MFDGPNACNILHLCVFLTSVVISDVATPTHNASPVAGQCEFTAPDDAVIATVSFNIVNALNCGVGAQLAPMKPGLLSYAGLYSSTTRLSTRMLRTRILSLCNGNLLTQIYGPSSR